MKLFKSLLQQQCLIEIEYEGEEGTGLGPTLEFYELVSKEIRELQLWRSDADNHALFPAPMDQADTNLANFEFIGQFVGKAISDQRLVNLPFSPLFWELLLGK